MQCVRSQTVVRIEDFIREKWRVIFTRFSLIRRSNSAIWPAPSLPSTIFSRALDKSRPRPQLFFNSIPMKHMKNIKRNFQTPKFRNKQPRNTGKPSIFVTSGKCSDLRFRVIFFSNHHNQVVPEIHQIRYSLSPGRCIHDLGKKTYG